MQCNAKSKTTGQRCKQPAVNGMTKCRFHGGLSPVGADSPNFKHGRYSKHLPFQLLDKYKEASKDKDLLNLREEIYLTDVRLKSLVEKLPDGGASHSWNELKSKWSHFLAVYDKWDTAEASKVIRQITAMIEAGADETITWENIQGTIERRRRLVASESKRLTDMQQIITAERAMALIYAMLDIIRGNLSLYRDKKMLVDNNLLVKISNEVRGLVTIPEPIMDDNNE